MADEVVISGSEIVVQCGAVADVQLVEGVVNFSDIPLVVKASIASLPNYSPGESSSTPAKSSEARYFVHILKMFAHCWLTSCRRKNAQPLTVPMGQSRKAAMGQPKNLTLFASATHSGDRIIMWFINCSKWSKSRTCGFWPVGSLL